MSEEKQVPSGDEEAKPINPENNPATAAGENEAPQSETNDPSLEEAVVPETEESTERVSAEETPKAENADTEESKQTSETELSTAAEAPEVPVEEAQSVAEISADEATASAPDASIDDEDSAPATEDAPSESVTEPAILEETPVEETTAAPETAADEAESIPVAESVSEPAVLEETPVDKVDAVSTSPTEESPESIEQSSVEARDAAAPTEATVQSQEKTEAKDSVAVENAVATDASENPESSETVETTATESSDAANEEAAHEEPEEDIDYSAYNREQLAEVVDELSKQDNFKHSDNVLSKVLPLFKAMARARRQEAYEKFIAEGGEEDDFEYRHDEVFNRFDASVRLIRDRRASYYKEREARKEENYKKKLEILDKLRELIDGENATTNLSPIKTLQEEWKALGPVPAQHNRTLWANYNALLDRFYNNRHILFELKELDRKKNLVKKTELCEKAEALDKLENIKDAIIQLNELHDEYKKIGAVPRDVQESLWQRFKAASDAIYKKRKTYLEGLKGELQENLEKKRALAEELRPYLNFDSDRINDWNAKTKEILAIQKRWDALGGLPREHAKEVNKAFWSAFKGFFSRKNAFFKKLEGMRHENLQKKEELVTKARELSESSDWDKTSEELKKLQRQWKEIGPVPEKHRNSVYAQFKEACDTFFNNRRASQDKAEAQYVENQKHKEALIKEIQDRAAAGDGEAGEMDDIMIRWNAIGFVPRSAIRTIEDKFKKAMDAFVASLDVADEEREALVMKAELSSLKKGPNSDRRLNKKESDLRRKVQEVEDNIALMNNNLSFFANSKGADKLRAEYDQKIADAEEELVQLKKQLRMVRSM